MILAKKIIIISLPEHSSKDITEDQIDDFMDKFDEINLKDIIYNYLHERFPDLPITVKEVY